MVLLNKKIIMILFVGFCFGDIIAKPIDFTNLSTANGNSIISITRIFIARNGFLDSRWVFAKSSATLSSYSNLQSGKYFYRLEGFTSYGTAFKIPHFLEIHIKPDWYNMTIVKLMLLLVLILFAIRITISIIKRQRKKTELLKIELEAKEKDLQAKKTALETKDKEMVELHFELNRMKKDIEQHKDEFVRKTEETTSKNDEYFAMASRINEADKLKLEYLSNIAHEIRTPLTLIKNPINQILDSADKSDSNYHKLATVKNNTEKLISMVNQLLDLNKIKNSQVFSNVIKADIINFSKKFFYDYRLLYEKKNLTFEFSSNIDHLVLSFDYENLEKILSNILSNAVKFTDDGGKIKFLIYCNADELTIKIEDTGVGIHENELDKIFDPFFQGDLSNTKKYEGAGIGLFHTKSLVQLLKGSISIESELNKGTKVIVSFKAGTQRSLENFSDSTNEKSQNISESPALVRKTTILIVEDNKEMAYYLKEELKTDFTIFLADNGLNGLKQCMAHVPDLIITDIMMPVMDGIELCKKIKNDERVCHIPCILLTAKTSESDVLEGIESLADDYIIKPFNINQLKAKIVNLLKTRELLRNKYRNEKYKEDPDIAVNNLDRNFMEKLIKAIEKNMQNSNFKVAELSKEIGYSKSNLYKKVLALTNLPIGDFIREIKLKASSKMLLDTNLSVNDVSAAVGYKDTSHFIKAFTKYYGYTPKKYLEHEKHS